MKIERCGCGESGFSIVELVIVTTIISIVGALAANDFDSLRFKAYNETAVSDLKNSITDQQAIYFDSSTYVSCEGSQDCEENLIGAKVSAGIETFRHSSVNFGSASWLIATSRHSNGDKTYMYVELNGEQLVPISGI